MSKLLLLGGSAEAVQLAKALVCAAPSVECITSLAGRTRNPRKVPGTVRTGGFGGVHGLVDYIRQNDIGWLVDATHPFATQMAHHAARAAIVAKIPRIKLLRPAWQPSAGDNWLVADSMEGAAHLLRKQNLEHQAWVFLTTGYQGLDCFVDITGVQFLVRLVDKREQVAQTENFCLITDRGPFHVDDEQRLLMDHAIQIVVSKNSGGSQTYAKIEAARRLRLPVIMIQRPAMPPGVVVNSVEKATEQITQMMARDGTS